jgi:hypothetical protein
MKSTQYFNRFEEILSTLQGVNKKERAWIELENELEQKEGYRRFTSYLSFRVSKHVYKKRLAKIAV